MFANGFTIKMSKVVCIHIGARAHYLIPKALQKKELLHTLITDTWVGNKIVRGLFLMFPVTIVKSLAGRYTSSLPKKKIKTLGITFWLYEIYLRLKYPYGWTLITKRDDRFQAVVSNKLYKLSGATSVMGISYTSLKCFQIAKSKNLKTILFQIDPGLDEENIVAELISTGVNRTSWERATKTYWQHWKEECMLADVIMVNSEWSKSGLINQGIGEHKIRIIPLPFDLKQEHYAFTRSYPDQFTKQRPLRCLFLGTLTLRKGIHLVLNVAKALEKFPIEFILVGRNEIDEKQLTGTNITYRGVVTREETERYYQEADVFLFPTLSDGFGLTQLEAMAWQLPVIASENCGNVVQHDHNGWVVDTIDSKKLLAQLQFILNNPSIVQIYSANTISTVKKFSTDKFANDLSEIV
jgi:glycosyltransferase involved in cell wall biosynthesis